MPNAEPSTSEDYWPRHLRVMAHLVLVNDLYGAGRWSVIVEVSQGQGHTLRVNTDATDEVSAGTILLALSKALAEHQALLDDGKGTRQDHWRTRFKDWLRAAEPDPF